METANPFWPQIFSFLICQPLLAAIHPLFGCTNPFWPPFINSDLFWLQHVSFLDVLTPSGPNLSHFWTHQPLLAAICSLFGCTDSFWPQFVPFLNSPTCSGYCKMLNHPGKNLAWNQSNERNIQPHNEDVAEIQHKNYFSPAQVYCIETLCAPCGVVVIAWTKFVKSESPTQILKFLKDTYPQKDTRPDYICIDKRCLVLKTCVANRS